MRIASVIRYQQQLLSAFLQRNGIKNNNFKGFPFILTVIKIFTTNFRIAIFYFIFISHIKSFYTVIAKLLLH